uniref:Uncharacterized protein n=1 Tax=Setaria digitata TaxID=48799 RepID=A0A915Q6B0_9BILA
MLLLKKKDNNSKRSGKVKRIWLGQVRGLELVRDVLVPTDASPYVRERGKCRDSRGLKRQEKDESYLRPGSVALALGKHPALAHRQQPITPTREDASTRTPSTYSTHVFHLCASRVPSYVHAHRSCIAQSYDGSCRT